MNEEYYIGQIFEGTYPSAVATWCNKNNAQTQEIDPVTKEVEETYIEIVQQEQEVVVPAVTHEEFIPAEYDEDGNIVKEEETVVVVDEPEHTEIITIDVPEERTRTVEKTFHRYEIQAIPEPTPPTHEEVRQMRAAAYQQEVDPITSHISRLKDKEQTEKIVAEIAELITERDAKVEEIIQRYPYPTDPIIKG